MHASTMGAMLVRQAEAASADALWCLSRGLAMAGAMPKATTACQIAMQVLVSKMSAQGPLLQSMLQSREVCLA